MLSVIFPFTNELSYAGACTTDEESLVAVVLLLLLPELQEKNDIAAVANKTDMIFFVGIILIKQNRLATNIKQHIAISR